MAGTLATIAVAPVRKPSKLEQQLAVLHGSPPADAVRAALRSKNGILIAAAAKHAPSEDLAAAFASLLEDPVKRDPVCRGKIAIARVLHDRDEWDDLFTVGVRHVQMEPAFEQPVDTAAELRGICGIAYAHCLRADALDVLADLLADPQPAARIAAVQGLGDSGRPDAAALLRFKLRLGDREGEVIAGCCDALLGLQREKAIDVVAALLDGNAAEIAAFALAESRLPGALAPLRAWVDDSLPGVRRSVGYLALALTRAAHDDLLAIVRTGDRLDALAAAKALATFKDDPSVRDKLLAAAPKPLRAEITALLA
jgi:hypothetical protein